VYIPYADSALTKVLRNAVGGNCKTSLLVTASPHASNDEETLATLIFGTQCRLVRNMAKVNQDHTVPELMKMLETAEKEIDQRKHHIQILEQTIEKLGGQLPPDIEN
jgi:kinesin family protein 5